MSKKLVSNFIHNSFLLIPGILVLLLTTCLFLIGHSTLVWAGEFTAFGPQDFIREKGAPVVVVNNFSVLNPNTEFILRVYNGGPQGLKKKLCSSAIISINGTQALGPNDFNQKVKFIEVPVILQLDNAIEVELRAKPGGLLTIHIVGIDSEIPDITPPEIFNLLPTDGSILANAKATISADFTDESSGIDTATAKITLNGVDITTSTQITLTGFTYTPAADLSDGEHTVTVDVKDKAGNSASQAQWSFIIDTIPPSAPTGLTAMPGDTIVNLSWNPNSESDLAGYNLCRSEIQGGPYTKINPILITTTSYQDISLTNGITYYYVLTAVDNVGNESSYSTETSAIPIASSIAQISSPAQDTVLREAEVVSIIGTAQSPDFNSYQLHFGEGIAPSYWYLMVTGDTPVEEGPLGSWDTTGLKAPVYTIRLTVTDNNENQISDQVNIDMFSIYDLSAIPNPFSPDGDGTLDTTTITADISYAALWTITLKDKDENIINTFSDSGSSISQIWDGKDSYNNTVSDGEYTYQIDATELISGVTASPAIGLITVKLDYNINIVADIAASEPVDLVVDSNRNLYILESATNQVVIYDKDGNYQNYVPLSTNSPKGMALDENGNIYIADTGNHRILKYKPVGSLDTDFGNAGVVGEQGQEDAQFNQPWGIGVDNEGNVYVADSLNHRIQKFDATGTFITKWGAQGTEPGQFDQPMGIFIDFYNNLHIADSLNNRIQEFSSSGSLWNYWGEAGSGNGQFSQPTDSCRDNYYIYVADTANNRVVKFDSYQQFLLNINGIGLDSPSSVIKDADPYKEYIWIADTGNNRVIKVELPMLDPKDVWNAMKQELHQKEVESALSYFSEGAKEKYRQVFNRLKEELPRIVDEMQEIHPISVQGNVAEYIIVRDESGEERGYFIYFIHDESGNWMIDEW
ncbi:MAG: Ig-like domain-containing protein [Nanoarchaeota archaeon]|nr:Ig-like domain-containing protein [Nanoarchaeota archaeon]